MKLGLALVMVFGACVIPTDETASDTDLTSADGVEHLIEFDAFVDVAPGASDDDARDAIHRQLKSAIGALREQGIGVADRDAQRNLAGMQLVRTRLSVPGGQTVERIRYHYKDQALVEKTQLPTGPIELVMLFGDYRAWAQSIQPACVDESTDAESLWYHYQPKRSACHALILAEQNAIDSARAGLDPATQISGADANRKFLATRATLVRATAAPTEWP